MKDKIARIGEFAERREGAEEIEEMKPTPAPPAPEPGSDSADAPKPEAEPMPSGVPADALKQKLIHVFSEIASKGMTPEEKKALAEDFEFWNGLMFEILDMGGNLKSTLEGVHLQLSPAKAMLLYAGSTAALIALLRPELVGKLIAAARNRKVKNVQTVPTTPAEPPRQETKQAEPPAPPASPAPAAATEIPAAPPARGGMPVPQPPKGNG